MFRVCCVDHGHNRRLDDEKLLPFGKFLEAFQQLNRGDLPSATFDFVDGLPCPFKMNALIEEELVVEKLSLSCHGHSRVSYFDP